MTYIILALTFIALNVIDVVLTHAIMARGGEELNPIIRAIGIIPVKVFGIIALLLISYFTRIEVLIGSCSLMAAVCVWNLIQLIRVLGGEA